MNLKSSKGSIGTDLTVAMIIIIITIPTIFGILYNIAKSNNYAKRQAYAVKIATDVVEMAKSIGSQELALTNGLFIEELNKKYTTSTYSNSELEDTNYDYVYYGTTGENGEHYQIQIGLGKSEVQRPIKKLNVTVLYPVGKEQKTVDIKTIIENT